MREGILDIATLSVPYWVPEEARSAILFVHGLGDACTTYQGLFQGALRDGIAIFALDLPGHGLNLAVKLTAEATIDAVKNVLVKVTGQTPRLTIVGHSLGGLLALLAMERLPATLIPIRMIGIEPSISPVDGQFFSVAAEMCGPKISSRLAEVSTIANVGQYGLSYRMNILRTSILALNEYISYVNRHFSMLSETAAAVTNHLYLFGAADASSDSRSRFAVEHCLRHASIANARHWAHIDNPAAVAREIHREWM